MPSAERTSEDRQGQIEEAADQTGKAPGATFRVCTAQDFGTGSRNERARRRPGMPSVACQTCRSRKIRCEVDLPAQRTETSSGFPPCQACQRSNIECCWNTIDKRKRRRVRSSQERPEDVGYEVSGTIVVADDDSSLERQSKERLEARKEDAEWARVALPSSETDTTRDNDREKTGNATLQSGEPQETQHQPREFFALENMDVSGDWSGIQDFVLDFEGMETIGGIDWDNGLEDAILKTVAEPSRTPGKAIRLRFSRRFGPTAVIPGMRRLSIAVRAHPDDASVERDHESPAIPYSRSGLSTKRSSTATRRDVSPEDSPYDLRMEVFHQVLDVFFERFGGHFPFIERQVLVGHMRSGQLSSFLLNSIAALSMPFCSPKIPCPRGVIDQGLEESWRKGTYFLKRAKEQLVTLMSIPATDVVSGLVILAWAEFGDNNEAGLWMLSGMAIRMAQDMGLHKPHESDTGLNATSYYHSPISSLSEEQSKSHQQRSGLVLFWAVFSLDVCVSLLTGRPPSFRRTEIEVPIPTSDDMMWTQLDFQESISMKQMAFPEMVRFMLFFSEAVELLNQPCSSGPKDTTDSDGKDDFSDIRERLMKQYQLLCPELTFNIENYKRASSSWQAGPFLMLHIYFYTFMTLLSDRGTRSNAASGGTQLSQPSKAALMASQKIVQILNTAELINNSGYLATPFTNHGLFVAASTILAGQQTDESNLGHQQSQDLFSLVSESDFDYLCQKIQEISHYFKGTGATLAALERKKRELVARKSKTNHCSEDEDSEEDKDAAVQLSDPGIVNRYSMPGRDG
ncbi:C6 transcription factor [Colletotrichum plurivorum]|uniref:C6 transcription factor n=1 Tax=Colletotrichum plurivorum TaxID=2175906 RepID=A0A8H6KFL2_9PEZI|nr:C6 transcription factor [Colletotrichum plurivorum]